MARNQYVGIIWIVVAVLYGVGTGIVQERWFTIGGAVVFLIMMMTIPIWRQWLPEGPETEG